MKGTAAHTAGIDGKPVGLRRLPSGNGLFDLCEVDHGDSFLVFPGDDFFTHKKSPHLRKSGNGGAIGTIRVDFQLLPDYNDFVNFPVFGRNNLKKR